MEEGAQQGGSVTPCADLAVISALQDLGDGHAAEDGGAGVVGVVEEAAGGVGDARRTVGCGGRGGIGGAFGQPEAFVEGGVGVAEDAGEEAGDGVDDEGCGEFAAGEDEVADGEFAVAEELGDAFVDAFVAAADEDDVVQRCEVAGGGLGEAGAGGGEENRPIRG